MSQIQSDKNDKALQLENPSSIKDLQVAEKLGRLKQFNNNNNNNNNNDNNNNHHSRFKNRLGHLNAN